MRFFFYGTLIDPDVRRIVLGARAAQAVELRAAVLTGWERRAVRHVSYPIIFPRASGRVDGLLASNLDAQSGRRLEAYEGSGYGLVVVEVGLVAGSRRSALVFAARHGGRLKPAMTGWSYAAWCAFRKRAFLQQIAGDWTALRP